MELFAASPAAWVAAVAVLGLVVGSFLNVVILRLPPLLEWRWRRECAQVPGVTVPAETGKPAGLVRPRSRCPSCRAPIRALHNIPVLSWLALRGRCAACQARISPRYPLVELLNALVYGWVYRELGLNGEAILIMALIVLIGSAILGFRGYLS